MHVVEEIEKNNWAFQLDRSYLAADEEIDKAIDAFEMGRFELAEDILKRVLKKYPYHINALHHLALFYSHVDLNVEAYIAAQAAVSIGLQSLPASFDWNKSKLEWGWRDNRSFLSALHLLALISRDIGQLDATIDLFTKLLSVNPNDNQGVRLLLPACYFEKGDPWLVVKHCRLHSNDHSPEVSYAHALGLVMIGEAGLAKKVLAEAVTNFPLVAKELLKKRHARPKGMRPGVVTLGGSDQAYVYWQTFGKFWDDSKTALEMLKELAA